jgi:ferric-dicitrate binding protein FerR (iron transport regulator)
MTHSSDPIYNRVHGLAVGLLEGALTDAQRQELESLLLDNPGARRAYLEHMQESACLSWLCVEEVGENLPTLADTQAAATRFWSRYAARIGIAGLIASLLGLAFGPQFFGSPNNRIPVANSRAAVDHPQLKNDSSVPQSSAVVGIESGRPDVATITSVVAAQWDRASMPANVLSRWSVGDRLKLQSGSAELTFDAGAQVTVFGPAEFEITSPTSIRCIRGRITTLVDKRGRGFSIETPGAKVVDLGTQFGLSISDQGETEVVVFQGSVDLSSRQDASDAAPRRMQQGEALLLKNSGEFERVMAVQRNSFMFTDNGPGRRIIEPVIADVRDNIRDPKSTVKSYQIVHGGLTDDALAFVDRYHQWNGLDSTGVPKFLAGADYIMPFNEDKFVGGLELKVRLLRPASLYVFLDNNMAVPKWLQEGFTDTGVDLGLDCSKTEWHRDHSLGVGPGKSIDFRFSVWKRDVEEAGTVVLGGISPPAVRSQGFNMYGIAAVASK